MAIRAEMKATATAMPEPLLRALGTGAGRAGGRAGGAGGLAGGFAGGAGVAWVGGGEADAAGAGGVAFVTVGVAPVEAASLEVAPVEVPPLDVALVDVALVSPLAAAGFGWAGTEDVDDAAVDGRDSWGGSGVFAVMCRLLCGPLWIDRSPSRQLSPIKGVWPW